MNTTLETGLAFPALDLVSASGAESSLAAQIGGRIAVVHVMRSSSCPVCLAHAAALQRLLDSGALGDTVAVLIAPGGVEEAKDAAARAARRSPSAEVFASESAHAVLGLGTVALLQQSATIVVDSAGVVRSVRASTLPMGSFSADEVRTAVADAARDAAARGRIEPERL
ncbi:redoxin domain-containing protein [Microbacterium sp. HD4P20]|uniref:redoxin domain-containing protein n=1 Tax=Microbacterium sp. HD4P20 TaxID=2864874 RepID=UPI001C63D815|nr:redoxin domain-containing protein [Microbacterium sp. HD4P20]MCP2635347.1 redoxin domain-containing protein [Microbacterium sp. HD4P20]